jgi:cyclophilin family peptidyl-prolyl cis-trans isomerase
LRISDGVIGIDLFTQQTPVTINNFVYLSLCGFYVGTRFHRVIDKLHVSGGGGHGSGYGGPGYTIVDEFVPELRRNSVGILSMANVGVPNTGGSQFFITKAPQPHLDDRHTVFGEVTSGLEIIAGMAARNPDTATTPSVEIFGIDIILSLRTQ